MSPDRTKLFVLLQSALIQDLDIELDQDHAPQHTALDLRRLTEPGQPHR